VTWCCKEVNLFRINLYHNFNLTGLVPTTNHECSHKHIQNITCVIAMTGSSRTTSSIDMKLWMSFLSWSPR
jgi:hypothetical protein